MSNTKRGREQARQRAELARQQAELAAKQQRERRIFIMVAIVVVALIIGGGIALQAWRTHRAPVASARPSASATPIKVSDGRPLLLGSDAAPVKITLYEDFHCPHCAEFEEEFGPTITAAQDQGKAVIELYPMSFIDAGSVAAANAMACGAEAGFGQAYYLGLFANPTLQWNDQQLIALGSQVGGGGPSDTFKTCVTSRAHADWVASINRAADANHVEQTPTMFLNSRPVDLATLTPETLQSMIDKAATP